MNENRYLGTNCCYSTSQRCWYIFLFIITFFLKLTMTLNMLCIFAKFKFSFIAIFIPNYRGLIIRIIPKRAIPPLYELEVFLKLKGNIIFRWIRNL